MQQPVTKSLRHVRDNPTRELLALAMRLGPATVAGYIRTKVNPKKEDSWLVWTAYSLATGKKMGVSEQFRITSSDVASCMTGHKVAEMVATLPAH